MESVGTKKRQSFEGGCLLNSLGRYGEGCCYDVHCIVTYKKFCFYTLDVTPKEVSPLIFKAFPDRIRFEKLVKKGSFLFNYFYRVIDKMLSIINYEF